MLEISNLSVNYGPFRALEGVALKVAAGECVALLGSNGAGKTTTLNTISGLLRPVSGSIRFQEAEIAGRPPHHIVKGGIVQVPEGRRVFPDLTVRENLAVGAYCRSAPSKADFDRIYDLFPRLCERTNQKAGTLSGGEQQMLAVGRALMAGPKLLLLDEPSLGLAPLIVEQLYEVLRTVKTSMTVLLVEQNVHLALELVDRAYVLRQGRIVKEGSARDLADSAWLRSAYLASDMDAAL
jgi:branched-chain amino acid transport system ATP-binding protein